MRSARDHGPFLCADVYNLPGIAEEEWLEYYPPESLQRLCDELRTHVVHQLDLFSESYDYEDYFPQADYDNPEDTLDEEDLAVFRSALNAEDRDTPLDDLLPSETLQACRAVMIKQIASGDLAKVRDAVEMFNGIMECMLIAVNEGNPSSHITIQGVREFAPKFVAGLIGSIERSEQAWRRNGHDTFLGQRFKPLQPLLATLQDDIGIEGWPRHDFSIGRLLLIVDYYKQALEEHWQK